MPVADRRFELFEYRQVLARMRLGDTDRAIARAGLMGRRKLAQLRRTAEAAGWLDVATPLPGDGELAVHLGPVRTRPAVAPPAEPHRERITRWWRQGIQGTTIHAARRHAPCSRRGPCAPRSRAASGPPPRRRIEGPSSTRWKRTPRGAGRPSRRGRPGPRVRNLARRRFAAPCRRFGRPPRYGLPAAALTEGDPAAMLGVRPHGRRGTGQVIHDDAGAPSCFGRRLRQGDPAEPSDRAAVNPGLSE